MYLVTLFKVRKKMKKNSDSRSIIQVKHLIFVKIDIQFLFRQKRLKNYRYFKISAPRSFRQHE